MSHFDADVNGAYNVIRKYVISEKVKSNALDGYDLMALPFMPVTYDPLRTHDFNFLDCFVNGYTLHRSVESGDLQDTSFLEDPGFLRG